MSIKKLGVDKMITQSVGIIAFQIEAAAVATANEVIEQGLAQKEKQLDDLMRRYIAIVSEHKKAGELILKLQNDVKELTSRLETIQGELR